MTQGNIYFDFNATTPVDPLVQTKVMEWISLWGNPSSIHQHGRGPKKLLRESRRSMAEAFNCHPLELVFTSGGSEANNLGIKGCVSECRLRDKKRTKIILGGIEHPSVMQQIPSLQSQGFEVVTLPVNRLGEYDLSAYEKELDECVALVSVMLANNELGVIAPLKEMVQKAHQVGAYFHSDFVQALGKWPFDLKDLNVDLASFSSHKVYALKGAGVLYVKKGTPLVAQVHGGAQERYRRAGTENLLSIASFALMAGELDASQFVKEISPLRDFLEESLNSKIPGVEIFCASQQRLPNTSSFCIHGLSGETLLMNMDIRGFSVGTGAACSSGNPEPSPVLLGIGLSRDEAQSSLRVSLGKNTTREQVEAFIKNLCEVVEHLRKLETSGEVHV